MSITETTVGTLRVYRPQLRLVHKHAKKELGQYPVLLYGKVNPSLLIGSFLVRISPYGPFPWKRSSAVYFFFRKPANSKHAWPRVPYNKLLTNLSSSSRTGKYWPSIVFERTSLSSVFTAMTSGQYSPVRPSRSVSKRLGLRNRFFIWRTT